MATDNSTGKSNPMGWGIEYETFDEKYKIEQEAKELLPPGLIVRQEAKPVRNERFLKKVQDLQAKDGIEGGICLKYLEEAVFDSFFIWLRQLIGSCVASGATRLITRRTLADIFVFGDLEKLLGTNLVTRDNIAPFAPYSYRAGRKLGNMNSNSDGSYCSVHIRGLQEYGILPCSTVGLESDAFPEPQNESTYRMWGSSRGDSLLQKFSETGKKFQLLESEEVKETTESKMLLREHLKGQMICSSWAFKPDYQHPTWKDRNGNPVWIYKRDTSTTWSHNLSVDGNIDVASKEFVWVDNSWGMAAHKNGQGFPIPASLHQEWLRSQYAESRSIGNIQLTDSEAPIAW